MEDGQGAITEVDLVAVDEPPGRRDNRLEFVRGDVVTRVGERTEHDVVWFIEFGVLSTQDLQEPLFPTTFPGLAPQWVRAHAPNIR